MKKIAILLFLLPFSLAYADIYKDNHYVSVNFPVYNQNVVSSSAINYDISRPISLDYGTLLNSKSYLEINLRGRYNKDRYSDSITTTYQLYNIGFAYKSYIKRINSGLFWKISFQFAWYRKDYNEDPPDEEDPDNPWEDPSYTSILREFPLYASIGYTFSNFYYNNHALSVEYQIAMIGSEKDHISITYHYYF